MKAESEEVHHVLVVDDEKSIRSFLALGLQRAGYVCTTVGSAEEALERVQDESIDAVITDIVMPGMSGLELMRELVGSYLLDVIVMTGFARDVRYEDVIREGARDFVVKPVRISELLTRLERVFRERNTEDQLRVSLLRSKRILNQTVTALSTALEKRDPYTAGHQHRTALLASEIAREMGLSDSEMETIWIAGLLHDLGKLTVPSDILTKPGKLSAVEFELIKTHPAAGYDILKEIEFEGPVAETVLQHHERLDGSGYPQGLSGDRILLPARILGVADTVEAMATHRPYRPGLSLEETWKALEAGKGSSFEARIVDVCRGLFENGAFSPWQSESQT